MGTSGDGPGQALTVRRLAALLFAVIMLAAAIAGTVLLTLQGPG